MFPGEDEDRREEDNIAENKKGCMTLQGGLGECILITNCRAIKMKNLDSEPNLAVLRKILCGFEDHIPKICCPLAKESSMGRPRPSVTTRKPTTSSTTRSPTRRVSTQSPGRVQGNYDLRMPDQLPDGKS